MLQLKFVKHQTSVRTISTQCITTSKLLNLSLKAKVNYSALEPSVTKKHQYQES